MILLPAIDIQGGSCVRLTKGDFSSTVTYTTDPIKTAKSFEQMGAEFLHIIDLDGANSVKSNKALIKDINKETNIPVQVGGGIRTLEDIKSLLDSGLNRIIVGSMPFLNRKDFLKALTLYKDRIVVSLDCSNDYVKINGWKDQTSTDIYTIIQELESLGVKTIVVTDIAKDGMLEGPNINLYKKLKDLTSMQIIASGGVTSLEDIKELASLDLYGAIIGKALYEGNICLKEALICSQNASSRV